MPRLRRSDCSTPGLRRRRRGRGFEYLDADGARVDDPETLARINALAIPPAWTAVGLCPDPRGRKQSRHHAGGRPRRDRQKFEEMLEFARALPRLRRRVARDLRAVQDGGVTRERVLACAARLLDRGFFRIGSESYAEGNGSYGLATIRKEHVRLNGDDIVFDYPSKSGRRRVQAVADPDVREVVAALKRRRGGADGLLTYREGRRWVEVRSDDINEYLKASARLDPASAKAFRTWNGTVLAAMALARREGRVSSKTARKRAITAAVREVAVFLGNSPA